MKPSKRQARVSNSKIKGNHQSKNSSMLLYILLFLGVGAIMITLNQTRKRNIARDPGNEYSDTRTNNPNLFVKEGELILSDSEGKKICSIDIEIADDDLQTQRGLMYRRTLKQDRGMLFIFPDEEERSFWMKNTLISLDIMYLNTNKEIVSISENTPPKSEESIWSELPAKYVLEVNAGFVGQYQIQVGNKMTFKRTY